MNRKILMVKNITREGPGLLELELGRQQIDFDLVDLDKSDIFPNPESYSGVVVLGGPDSANDMSEKMRSELDFVRQVIELKIPYLGICLGLQVLVKAAGGKVVKSPLKEVGFRDPNDELFSIKLTDLGSKDSLFEGLGGPFHVFHLHGETVEITPEMKLLGQGKFCKNQIVRMGENAYGIQCHFELTPQMFEFWLQEDPDLLALDQDKLRSDFEQVQKEYTRVGQQLFRNFLKLI